jgi:anthranilate synthase / indole-3-glycerol phosphate synthase / phosphoribosylanthranilate isomerase
VPLDFALDLPVSFLRSSLKYADMRLQMMTAHLESGKTILIDNYDSFTWNVYQLLCELGANVAVFRNDQVTLQQIIDLAPRNIVISPGPGKPSDAAISLDAIRHFAGKIPILGICLGEQCMFEIFGGVVSHAGYA